MKDNLFAQLYNSLLMYPSLQSIFSAYDVLVNFFLPCILLIPVTLLYKRTHRGVTYTQNFVHTMFILSVTTSIIMMIIGSNIARAFSLVGALSIIRFRTAVKDSKDTSYIFLAIAIGMASGTGMYLVAGLFTLFACVLLTVLSTFHVGEKLLVDKLLKFSIEESRFDTQKFQSILKKYAKDFSLIHTELASAKGEMVHTYIISVDHANKDDNLLKDIREFNQNKMASIYYNDQRVEI